MNDKKLFLGAIALLVLPLTLAFFGGDRFRYPCQDPDNWEKDFCKMPRCDVTRTCPEHIFKGQNDPRVRLGGNKTLAQNIPTIIATPATGANCK